ncbi:MAG: tetratricopeptide repeat protein [Nitrospirae bacterium]|nr:tetratricopeptide repeat protein [Nitrospirota bacterium]
MKKTLLILLVMIVSFCPSILASDTLDKYLVSPDLKRVWTLLQAEKYSAASQMRIKFQDDKTSLSIYHFLFAKVLASKHKYLEAIDNYGMASSAFASVKPESISDLSRQIVEVSMLERAQTYYKIEYYVESYGLYLMFIKNNPSSKYIDTAYAGIAQCLIEMGRPHEAMGYANKITPSAAAQYIKANIYQSFGDTQNADLIYKNVVQADKAFLDNSDSTKYYYGETLRQTGNLTLAKRYLVQLYDKPFVYRAALSMGLINLEEGNSYSALKYFNQALEAIDYKIRKDASINIAKAYLKDKKPYLAKPYIVTAISLNPTQAEKDNMNLLLIKTLRLSGEYDKASEMLKDFIAKHGSAYNGVLDEVEALLVDVKDNEKDKFPKIWKMFSSIFYANKNMKVLYMAKDALKNSIEESNNMLTWLSNNGPDDVKADSLKELAELKALSGDHQGLLSLTGRLKKISGANDWLTRMEAISYYLSKQNSMAYSMLKNIKILDAKDIEMLRETFTSDKDVRKSIGFYEDIVQKRGGAIEDYLKLADVYYFNLKNNEKALKYYQLALKTEPDNGWALYMTAILSNNIEEAKKMYEKISSQKSVYGKMAATILEQNVTRKSVSEVQ